MCPPFRRRTPVIYCACGPPFSLVLPARGRAPTPRSVSATGCPFRPYVSSMRFSAGNGRSQASNERRRWSDLVVEWSSSRNRDREIERSRDRVVGRSTLRGRVSPPAAGRKTTWPRHLSTSYSAAGALYLGSGEYSTRESTRAAASTAEAIERTRAPRQSERMSDRLRPPLPSGS